MTARALRTSLLAAAALAAVAAIEAPPAAAATGLAIVCTNAGEAGKLVAGACPDAQVYRTPAPTDLVRYDTARPAGQPGDYNSGTSRWTAFSAVPEGGAYEICTSDVPDPSAMATSGAPCTAWQLAGKASAALFSASATSGVAPLSTVLTWNVPGGRDCQAGGVWSGAKAASGTETLSVVASGAATLTCTVAGPAGPGAVTLSWTAPTQNTDGTPYTNPKGYLLYRGASDASLARFGALIPPATLSFRVTDLPPNVVHWLGVRAVNTQDTESDLARISTTSAGTPTSTTFSAPPISFAITQPLKRPRAPVLSIVADPAP